MKANEIKDSEEFVAGIKWQVESIEHVIDMNISEGDYSDVYWQVDKPIALQVLAGLYDDRWHAEVVHRPTVSTTIVVKVADSMMTAR